MTITASQDTVKEGNVIICMIDEYRNNNKEAFDCNILSVNEKGADVVYLSGYKSRNDFVEWSDMVAKVDKRKPQITVADGTFTGHFAVFSSEKMKEI